ncbi:biotin-independent malonate decarboxylase subunit gamma [Cuneatibacter sp. NSJ-177]|uniref:biotin-independent malonate decarboxylase subunit gamma n=1 Tax=Cuneatibacter sp. NSJ-177 TaxID=2931401 RepID=UPI001FD12245|nr:biotin-independent malonate decarboxylase subunit gamma [Cuneatibacter sp. NSJ-177]
MTESLIGKGREAIDWLLDSGSFRENLVAGERFPADLGPGAVVGSGLLDGQEVTVLANDAQAINEKFPVVYFGVIGLEEAYKMALAVYAVREADRKKPASQKRPLLLLVDTPGNAPGKLEEIAGMNKATGAYQLALAEARMAGHPVIAVVIGRAISGAFLCHGLQADRILAMNPGFGTMIHVMPVSSISRITKLDIEQLEALSKTNPVFAAGADFFYRLGGVEEIIDSVEEIRPRVIRQIGEVREQKAEGKTGPMGRAALGNERGGRVWRSRVIRKMEEEYAEIADSYRPWRKEAYGR